MNWIIIDCTYNLIEQKGMTFDHDFGYSFIFTLKKEGRRKGEYNSKNYDQNSCLSARY